MIEIGNRNNELTKKAKQLYDKGKSKDFVLINLSYWNIQLCEAILPEEELITLVNNLFRG